MRCANPSCNAEALYYRNGSLHWISSADDDDGPIAGGKHGEKVIWLCQKCSSQTVVQSWRPPGQQIRKRNTNSAVRAARRTLPELDPQSLAKAS